VLSDDGSRCGAGPDVLVCAVLGEHLPSQVFTDLVTAHQDPNGAFQELPVMQGTVQPDRVVLARVRRAVPVQGRASLTAVSRSGTGSTVVWVVLYRVSTPTGWWLTGNGSACTARTRASVTV